MARYLLHAGAYRCRRHHDHARLGQVQDWCRSGRDQCDGKKTGLEPSLAFAYAAMFLESVGGVCLIVGLFTRFFAAALAIEMLIAMFAVHWARGFSVSQGGYEFV